MPSASSSASGGQATKTGKQGSKARGGKRPEPTGGAAPKLPAEDEINNASTTDETTKNSNSKTDQPPRKSSRGPKGVNQLPNNHATDDQQTGLATAEGALDNCVVKQLEHKIRNLEKRKTKLDGYKAEQANGKQLNADQLQAVSKYHEVKSQLDFAKELEKGFKETMEASQASLKKQLTKETVERIAANLERSKLVLTFISILRELMSEEVRRDFSEGKNGAVKLSEEQLNCLTELQSVTIDTNLWDDNKLEIAAERLSSLIDEQTKVVCGHMTCKDAKELLLELSKSEYFKSASAAERTRLKKEQEEQEKKAIEDAQTARAFKESSAAAEAKETLRAYNLEAQLDLTRVDPAVVAVSYTAPIVSHENSASRFNPVSRGEQQHQGQGQSQQGMMTHGHGGGDVNLNSLSLKEESIDNWTNPPPPATQEWTKLGEGPANNAGLNEAEGMDFEFQNRRDGERGQYQNRGRQPAAVPVNNGYRGSPNQYQKPGGNLNGKTHEPNYDGRPRYDRGDNIYDSGTTPSYPAVVATPTAPVSACLAQEKPTGALAQHASTSPVHLVEETLSAGRPACFCENCGCRQRHEMLQATVLLWMQAEMVRRRAAAGTAPAPAATAASPVSHCADDAGAREWLEGSVERVNRMLRGDFRGGPSDRGRDRRQFGFGNRNDGVRADGGNSFLNQQRYAPSMQGPRGGLGRGSAPGPGRGGGGGGGGGSFRGNGGGMFQ